MGGQSLEQEGKEKGGQLEMLVSWETFLKAEKLFNECFSSNP